MKIRMLKRYEPGRFPLKVSEKKFCMFLSQPEVEIDLLERAKDPFI